MERYLTALSGLQQASTPPGVNAASTPAPPALMECPWCGHEITLSSEVARVTISYSVEEDDKKTTYPVLCEATGDLLYKVEHVHTACWHEIYSLMQEAATTANTRRDGGLFMYMDCSVCPANIREGEKFGKVEYGEIVKSDRYPNNQVVYLFEPWERQAGARVCLNCLLRVSTDEERGCIWEDVSEMGECGDCTDDTCWRHTESCDCDCHSPDEEDEGEE